MISRSFSCVVIFAIKTDLLRDGIFCNLFDISHKIVNFHVHLQCLMDSLDKLRYELFSTQNELLRNI